MGGSKPLDSYPAVVQALIHLLDVDVDTFHPKDDFLNEMNKDSVLRSSSLVVSK